MSIRKERIIVSNDWHDPHRESEFRWGDYPVDNEHAMQSYSAALSKIRDKFNSKLIKWYMVYEETMDYDTASFSVVTIEKGAHKELPTVEFNLAAKGYKPTNKFTTLFKGPPTPYSTGEILEMFKQTQMEMDACANQIGAQSEEPL